MIIPPDVLRGLISIERSHEMNLFDRIILTVCMLALALVSVTAILFSSGLIDLQDFWTRLAALHGRWEVGLVGLAFLVASLWLLFSGLKTRRHRETVVKTGDMGNISISLTAIENLVLKITRDIEKVKDVKVNIIRHDGGVSVFLRLVVTYDVIIPEMTSELQKAVKEYIENTAGITVREVRISVDNIYNPYKQRTVK
jgi:hypothetical protein